VRRERLRPPGGSPPRPSRTCPSPRRRLLGLLPVVTVGGPDVPTAPSVGAGWEWGTDRQEAGEFSRAEITAVTFR
jgi:hypothetical protein